MNSVATALWGGSANENLSREWDECEVAVVTLTQVQKAATNRAGVRDFCDQISKLNGGIDAVMVEELEDRTQHVTTFVSERSRELEAEIYSIEAAIIKKHPEVLLDFNVRVTPRGQSGNPELPDGSYYLLTWRAA